MKLPKLVVALFRRSCQEDMERIEDFITKHDHMDLTLQELEELDRLRTTLGKQWGRMEMVWCNHDPKTGNIGAEALAEL